MKKIQILLVAMTTVLMSACVSFKTEATVDVEVMQKGKPQVGVTVYKIPGDRSPLYKDNATGSAVTNAGGVAHFDIKSPDDITPSSIAGQEFSDQASITFAVYDKNNDLHAYKTITVKTGDKLTIQLEVPEKPVNED